jgi:hypothetical protein
VVIVTAVVTILAEGIVRKVTAVVVRRLVPRAFRRLSAIAAGTEIRMVSASIVASIAASTAGTESVMVVPQVSAAVLPVLATTPSDVLVPRVVTHRMARGKASTPGSAAAKWPTDSLLPGVYM